MLIHVCPQLKINFKLKVTVYLFQHFSATFETVVEGMSTPQSKMRNLMFELCGEGNLPRISVAKPVVRNKKGQPLLLYRRNLLGQTQTLPLVIVNDGTLLSRVSQLFLAFNP